MMKSAIPLALAGLMALSATMTTLAGEKGSSGQVYPAEKIFNMEVKNSSGEHLGYVSDIVFNLKSGDIAYVAMSRGEVIGFGGSLYAIAPDLLSPSTDHKFLVMKDTSPKEFEGTKGFDSNQWPTQPTWKSKVKATSARQERDQADNQKGKETEVAKTRRLTRITAIQGSDVQGNDGKSVGSIYDVAINCENHKVVYAAVSHGSTLGIGGKLVAVPWNALHMKSPNLRPRSIVFHVNATYSDFDNAEGFTSSDRWPAMGNKRFVSEKK